MKTIAKLTALSVLLATGVAASAHEPERRLVYPANSKIAPYYVKAHPKITTIAVYAGKCGTGQQCEMPRARTESRFEMRTNAHGDRFGLFVPVK